MNIYNLILLGVGVMLLLALGIIFFVVMYQRRVIRHQEEIRGINEEKQRELTQASIIGEEKERTRIASELHDDVGATLSSIRLYLYAAGQNNADQHLIAQGKDLVDECIKRIRYISHKLQPAMLDQLGLQPALEAFTNIINQTNNVHMSYNADNHIPRFDSSTELSIYRVVQELINNIQKHAKATVISLDTQMSQGMLNTTILHDGSGLTDETFQLNLQKKDGLGLKNILNRIKSINASIAFTKESPDQFSITITSPVDENTKSI